MRRGGRGGGLDEAPGRPPGGAAALAAGAISPSWARHICAWTGQLPEDGRDDADEILLAAAAGGAVLPDLAALAEELRRRTAAPDPGGPDGDDGFDERRVRLGLTFGGAGVLDGELTPACAAALQAVLEALGKKAGPEDVRTAPQRRHDALEEACRRLTGAGCLPDRAGQPTQIQLHLTLDQLRDLPGAADAEAAWTAAQAARAAAEGQPGWLTGRAAQGHACDAAITPIVTGSVDQAALAALAAELLAGLRDGCAVAAGPDRRPVWPAPGAAAPGRAGPAARHPAPARRRHPVRPGRAGRLPAHPPHRGPVPLGQPAAGCRHPHQPDHRHACAARSSPATGTAPSPAATPHPPPARSTTSTRNAEGGQTNWPTWSCCAPSTT